MILIFLFTISYVLSIDRWEHAISYYFDIWGISVETGSGFDTIDVVFSKTDVTQKTKPTVVLEQNLANNRIARHLIEQDNPAHIDSQSTRKYCEFSIIFDDAGDAYWLPKGSFILKQVLLKLKHYP